jgi:hypothetical protein
MLTHEMTVRAWLYKAHAGWRRSKGAVDETSAEELGHHSLRLSSGPMGFSDAFGGWDQKVEAFRLHDLSTGVVVLARAQVPGPCRSFSAPSDL